MDMVDDLSHMKKNHKEQLCIRPLDCQLLIAHVTCQLQENKRIDS